MFGLLEECQFLTTFNLSSSLIQFDEGFASFITENAEYERKLSSEINDKATKNVAAAPYYGFLKEVSRDTRL